MTAVAPSNILSRGTDKMTVDISTGATGLSDAAYLGGHTLACVQLSTAWTDAAITFQGSLDGTTYADIYNSTAGEVTYGTSGSTAIVGRIINFDPATFSGIPWIKVRSGPGASAVAQGAARTITLGLV